jgi:hypothetical protein
MKIQILGAVIALFLAEAYLSFILTVHQLGFLPHLLVVAFIVAVAYFGGMLAAFYLTSPSKN